MHDISTPEFRVFDVAVVKMYNIDSEDFSKIILQALISIENPSFTPLRKTPR